MSRRYWLFKSEPESFSIDDLAAKSHQTEGWDGIRNYQARNLLRDDVKIGDGVLFYHSNSKPTGIAGFCEITSKPYPDHTAFDPSSKYYDPKSKKEEPRWFLVDMKFRKKLPRLISLQELKEAPGLESMMVTRRGMRLSIQPVSPAEWKVIQGMAKKLK